MVNSGDDKKRKRIINIKNRRMFLLSILIFASVFIISLLIRNYYRKINSIRYDNYDLYQYFSGAKINYKGVFSVRYDNSVTKVESVDKRIDVGFIPIYFEKISNAVIFPVDMELIFPKYRNKNYRLRYLSVLTSDGNDEDEMAFIGDDSKKKYLDSSFLYDGDDLYFFPYSTKVMIDDKEYQLSSLSYIIVNYKGLIELYNKHDDKYIMIDSHEKDVIAMVDNFKINLSTDMVMYDNENKLLIKSVDKLPIYN